MLRTFYELYLRGSNLRATRRSPSIERRLARAVEKR
jgi:hypothetical protein